MANSSLALLGAGLLGIVVGIIAMLAFKFSEHEQRSAPRRGGVSDDDEPALDQGIGQVLAVIRSAAVVVDHEQRVVKASAAAYAFGLVRDGRLVHERTAELVAQARRSGLIQDEEIELARGPIGLGRIFLDVRVAALGLDNVVILAEDRTESRRLEEIRRDFVANVSHELKTPVGAIALLAEAVNDAADDPVAVRRFATRMTRESARLGHLVQEIIELSRLQVADAFSELTRVALDDVVAEAVDRARLGASAKRIDIEVGGTRDVVVFGDHSMLVNALRNLLDNAVHYSEQGTHVGVGVSVRDSLAEISVVDQGIGIAETERDRIFERFYRVDSARSRETGGTGLGLSIVKHIAANHGGEVTVWSSPGHGSTFTLRIPVADTAAEQPGGLEGSNA